MDLMDACKGSNDKKTPQDKLCGNSSYQAAGDRQGKAANSFATGHFLMGCAHMLVLKIASMPATYGHERYGYAWLMMACESNQCSMRAVFFCACSARVVYDLQQPAYGQ
jgi:hypothetical protein